MSGWMWIVWVLVLTFGIIVFRGAPYVPSKHRDIKKALKELYPLSSKDVLVDVGSGDGIVLRIASKYGAKAVGYELNPILILISKFLSRNDSRARVKLADFWITTLPDDVTIVYAFLVTRDVKKMINKLTKEATRLNRPIHCLSYGNKFIGMVPERSLEAYYLYTFYPLHS